MNQTKNTLLSLALLTNCVFAGDKGATGSLPEPKLHVNANSTGGVTAADAQATATAAATATDDATADATTATAATADATTATAATADAAKWNCSGSVDAMFVYHFKTNGALHVDGFCGVGAELFYTRDSAFRFFVGCSLITSCGFTFNVEYLPRMHNPTSDRHWTQSIVITPGYTFDNA